MKARFRSFVFAARGLHLMVEREHNARVHLAAAAVAVAAGFLLHISASDWRWIVLAIAIVWLAEAFNTALEHLCDRVSPQFDATIGRVKDIAAGAVLVASIAAALIGLLTLVPPLLRAVS
ncbi:diacylglycerol kinase family protein [Novosphingobium kaempferiae]|uniref:diacylglycerol kinase family protein n=1 Tax=Novosphingobium kaempferiae TaxID=2896849 RepID=UPI001E61C2A4|nr:diacylglycerol kinase family protein [Novosphingobium kaempferiae]